MLVTKKQIELMKKESKSRNGAELKKRVDKKLYIVVKNDVVNWYFRYTHVNTGKRDFIRIGRFEDVAEEYAKNKAASYRFKVSQGIDIKKELKEEKEKRKKEAHNLFKNVVGEFLKNREDEIKKASFKNKVSVIENHILPYFGNIPITDVDVATVRDVLQGLQKQLSACRIQRTLMITNEILNYAVNASYIKYNPCSKLSKIFKPHKTTHFASLKPNELPQLTRLFKRLYDEWEITDITYLLFLWQLHTMCRPAEAVRAEWGEIDEDKKLWTVPAEKMKMGAVHIVPLTTHTMEIIDTLKEITGGEKYLFASDRSSTGHVGVSTIAKRLLKTELKNKTTAHGFRSLASTILNEKGFNSDLIEKALAHSNATTIRGIYNRAEYLERRREIMQWWGDLIENSLTCDTVL